MDMYPDNQELTLNGEKVMWPGVDASGKFTNGDFNDPLVPPSFIPAETINLILDNLAGLIKRSGGTPNNTSLTQLADAIDRRFIQIFQNGYIQWPGMPTPDTLFTFEGYRWAEVDYDGCFFRAKGKGANPFNGEEQEDAIRNIYGSLGVKKGHTIYSGYVGFGGSVASSEGMSASSEGAFLRDWTLTSGLGSSYDNGSIHFGPVYFDASRVVPTAKENRSRNRTFIIWKLEKI